MNLKTGVLALLATCACTAAGARTRKSRHHGGSGSLHGSLPTNAAQLQLQSPNLRPSIVSLHGDNVQHRDKYFSQIGQDALVDRLLQSKRNGVFIESGAYNGVELSNTLFLEATRGWKGLLIEANPYLYAAIVKSSNRTCNVINACLSPTSRPDVLPFRLAGPIGGLVSEFSEEQVSRISSEKSNGEDWMRGKQGSTKDVSVPCWPLDMMLDAWGVTSVDYWSLDTEGSEASILRATNFSRVDVKIITVEVNNKEAEAAVHDAMKDAPYRLHSKIDFDLVFVRKDFDTAAG